MSVCSSVHGQRRRAARASVAELVAEDHPLRGRRGVVQDDVGHRAAPVQGAQHRHHRGDAAAADQEQHLRRRRVGQHEVALGQRQPDDRARLEAVDQVGGEHALGHRPHGDRDGPAAALRRRAHRVGAPLELAVDLDADADVLARAGGRSASPSPGRITSVAASSVSGIDLLDPAAQLARAPERVDQAQVVVGVQRRGQLASRPRAPVPTGSCCRDMRRPPARRRRRTFSEHVVHSHVVNRTAVPRPLVRGHYRWSHGLQRGEDRRGVARGALPRGVRRAPQGRHRARLHRRVHRHRDHRRLPLQGLPGQALRVGHQVPLRLRLAVVLPADHRHRSSTSRTPPSA